MTKRAAKKEERCRVEDEEDALSLKHNGWFRKKTCCRTTKQSMHSRMTKTEHAAKHSRMTKRATKKEERCRVEDEEDALSLKHNGCFREKKMFCCR
ncbi:Glutamate--tRNA ligase 2 [Sesbania bispinosa]|nr:Glutamate--tRNA ligase 2 [Sesbania bispinosa]